MVTARSTVVVRKAEEPEGAVVVIMVRKAKEAGAHSTLLTKPMRPKGRDRAGRRAKARSAWPMNL